MIWFFGNFFLDEFFFFLGAWLNLAKDTKLPMYPKRDQVIM